ncbi:MAG: DUF3570 domain-containing protein [Vicinamibacteria bacterium]
MQLASTSRPRAVRSKLRAATCMLLASVAPSGAHAADAPQAAPPTNQFDVTGLFYTERIRVLEPTVRFTRIYSSGRSFFGQLSIDSVTGASPSGMLPSGATQTFTSASGNRRTVSATGIPTVKFTDMRFALDGEWQQPVDRFTYAIGGHISHEKDYDSKGVTGKLSIDLHHKLTTLTFGGGYNKDDVSPISGITVGLSPPGLLTGDSSLPKHVKTGLIGVSQVLSRRWLVGLTGSLAAEDGYLTDPYKELSIVNRSTGLPVSQISEMRPDTRRRKSVQADSVYHFTSNILYLSYRRYWDDWGVGSHTLDAKYRLPLWDSNFVEPHLRYYNQTAADFYHWGLIQGNPLPQFATSDYRMAGFQSITLGGTIGLVPQGSKHEWTIRAEYIGQFGNSFPAGTVGVQSRMDLFPTVGVFSVVLNYRFNR